MNNFCVQIMWATITEQGCSTVRIIGGAIANGLRQVQAIGMYGAAQPDFFKSETT